MPGFMPGIHVLVTRQQAKRGWPGRAQPWRAGTRCVQFGAAEQQ